MKDSAGVSITVGCRVRENDLGFGDGLVESIEVPTGSGLLNVGIKWDKAEKDGPGWSEEGGGRGAQHLLVIEAAPDTGTGLPPREFSESELKRQRFRERFARSPATSEAELNEDEWSEIESDEGEEGGGDGGARQQRRQREEEAEPEAIIEVGKRIQMTFEEDGMTQWEGALVCQVADGDVVLGFDDGDLKAFALEQLKEGTKKGLVKAAAAELGGIVRNSTGHACAAEMVMHKDGSKEKAIGLLVGKSVDTVGSLPIYLAFYLAEGAFAKPSQPRRAAAPSTQSQQDRLGLHTFRRGDKVTYTQGEANDVECEATVFGTLYTTLDQQVRKMLVLFDTEAETFFLGAWPAWRRMPKSNVAAATFNCDDNASVQVASSGACEEMVAKFATAATMQAIDTVDKAKRRAAEVPPRIKVVRDQVKRREEEERATARSAQRERDKAADKKKQGGGGKGGAGDPPPRDKTRDKTRCDPPPRDPPLRDPPLRDRPPHDRSPHDSPPPRKKHKHDTAPSSSSSSSNRSTPYSAVQRRERLAAEEAAQLARLRAQVERDDRKRHERKHKKKHKRSRRD